MNQKYQIIIDFTSQECNSVIQWSGSVAVLLYIQGCILAVYQATASSAQTKAKMDFSGAKNNARSTELVQLVRGCSHSSW